MKINLKEFTSKYLNKKVIVVGLLICIFIIFVFIAIILSNDPNTAPKASKAAECIEQCPDNHGMLQNCHPPDSDGSPNSSPCTNKGRVEKCGDNNYCCTGEGGKWVTDFAQCGLTTPTLTPTPTSTTTPPKSADYDKSGEVDIKDFPIFVKYYKSGDLLADLNSDNKVDIQDFQEFRAQYLQYV